VKNREEANSATIRAKQWDWFLDVADTRLEPGGWMLVVMTRWHRDDLAGRLISHFKDEFTVLRIPAIADGLDTIGRNAAPDLLGRKVGEALWAERYNAAYLERVRAKNPVGFYSLYQGLPRPKEDYAFGQPTYYEELPKDGLRYAIGGDLAYTMKTHSNHSVEVVMAECQGVYYVVDVQRWRSRLMASIDRLRGSQEKYPFTGITLEDNGPQTAVCDMLEANGIYVNRLQPVGDKYTRSLPLAEAWNAGLVRVPRDAEWLDAYLEEMMSFTGINDAADDQVDASVNAFRSLETAFSFLA
jgi:predicted phage terminase large subunit-like protein